MTLFSPLLSAAQDLAFQRETMEAEAQEAWRTWMGDFASQAYLPLRRLVRSLGHLDCLASLAAVAVRPGYQPAVSRLCVSASAHTAPCVSHHHTPRLAIVYDSYCRPQFVECGSTGGAHGAAAAAAFVNIQGGRHPMAELLGHAGVRTVSLHVH